MAKKFMKILDDADPSHTAGTQVKKYFQGQKKKVDENVNYYGEWVHIPKRTTEVDEQLAKETTSS